MKHILLLMLLLRLSGINTQLKTRDIDQMELRNQFLFQDVIEKNFKEDVPDFSSMGYHFSPDAKPERDTFYSYTCGDGWGSFYLKYSVYNDKGSYWAEATQSDKGGVPRSTRIQKTISRAEWDNFRRMADSVGIWSYTNFDRHQFAIDGPSFRLELKEGSRHKTIHWGDGASVEAFPAIHGIMHLMYEKVKPTSRFLDANYYVDGGLVYVRLSYDLLPFFKDCNSGYTCKSIFYQVGGQIKQAAEGKDYNFSIPVSQIKDLKNMLVFFEFNDGTIQAVRAGKVVRIQKKAIK